MSVPPEAITAAAEAMNVHRWKSMGAASVECECGEILFGPGLTQFPADEAFRRHLAVAVLTDAGSAIADAERDRISRPEVAEDGSRFCRVCGADLLCDPS